jgi:hypothetical protein
VLQAMALPLPFRHPCPFAIHPHQIPHHTPADRSMANQGRRGFGLVVDSGTISLISASGSGLQQDRHKKNTTRYTQKMQRNLAYKGSYAMNYQKPWPGASHRGRSFNKEDLLPVSGSSAGL